MTVTLKVTLGHLKLVAFVVWCLGGLPTLTWLTLIQFVPGVSYWQVFLPYLLAYALLLSFEIVRGFVAKGA